MSMNPHLTFKQNPNLSLYIHFPWCVKKCPYCDFNSHEVGTHFDESNYINALLADLEADLPLIWGRPINSIFMGGGTPSLFSAEALNQLMSGIRARVSLATDAEITLEANPGTAESSNFQGYREAGINRLSIGVQSFDNQMLQKLGRIHDAKQAQNAFQLARDAGFERINLDIMYALPGQSVEQALADLSLATELSPEHISWYQLTLEPNTVFYSKPPQLPDEELQHQIFSAGIEHLEQHKYQRYEVSAFSKQAEQSTHNLNYWSFGDYLGIGAGAHSKITHVPNNQILRRKKTRQPETYLDPNKAFLAAETPIKIAELPVEFMMNALRLCEGVPERLFAVNTGLSSQLLDDIIGKAIEQELMKNWPQRIQPTTQGLQFLNNTLALFFEENFPQLSDKNTISITQI